MRKFNIWTHYDTGVQQTIDAENEDEALEKAEENLDSQDFQKQLLANMQRGESDADDLGPTSKPSNEQKSSGAKLTDKLRKIIEDAVVKPSAKVEVRLDTNLSDVMDSLSLVEMTLDIQKEYGIVITDDELEAISTVKDIARLIKKKETK